MDKFFSFYVLIYFFVSYNTIQSLPVDQYEYKHHNNQELNYLLQNIHLKYPSITRLYQLSERSVNGWPLTVIEISANPGQHELRKCLLIDHNLIGQIQTKTT